MAAATTAAFATPTSMVNRPPTQTYAHAHVITTTNTNTPPPPQRHPSPSGGHPAANHHHPSPSRRPASVSPSLASSSQNNDDDDLPESVIQAKQRLQQHHQQQQRQLQQLQQDHYQNKTATVPQRSARPNPTSSNSSSKERSFQQEYKEQQAKLDQQAAAAVAAKKKKTSSKPNANNGRRNSSFMKKSKHNTKNKNKSHRRRSTRSSSREDDDDEDDLRNDTYDEDDDDDLDDDMDIDQQPFAFPQAKLVGAATAMSTSFTFAMNKMQEFLQPAAAAHGTHSRLVYTNTSSEMSGGASTIPSMAASGSSYEDYDDYEGEEEKKGGESASYHTENTGTSRTSYESFGDNHSRGNKQHRSSARRHQHRKQQQQQHKESNYSHLKDLQQQQHHRHPVLVTEVSPMMRMRHQHQFDAVEFAASNESHHVVHLHSNNHSRHSRHSSHSSLSYSKAEEEEEEEEGPYDNDRSPYQDAVSDDPSNYGSAGGRQPSLASSSYKTEEEVKVEKQRKWKRKMKLAQQQREQEQATFDYDDEDGDEDYNNNSRSILASITKSSTTDLEERKNRRGNGKNNRNGNGQRGRRIRRNKNRRQQEDEDEASATSIGCRPGMTVVEILTHLGGIQSKQAKRAAKNPADLFHKLVTSRCGVDLEDTSSEEYEGDFDVYTEDEEDEGVSTFDDYEEDKGNSYEDDDSRGRKGKASKVKSSSKEQSNRGARRGRSRRPRSKSPQSQATRESRSSRLSYHGRQDDLSLLGEKVLEQTGETEGPSARNQHESSTGKGVAEQKMRAPEDTATKVGTSVLSGGSSATIQAGTSGPASLMSGALQSTVKGVEEEDGKPDAMSSSVLASGEEKSVQSSIALSRATKSITASVAATKSVSFDESTISKSSKTLPPIPPVTSLDKADPNFIKQFVVGLSHHGLPLLWHRSPSLIGPPNSVVAYSKLESSQRTSQTGGLDAFGVALPSRYIIPKTWDSPSLVLYSESVSADGLRKDEVGNFDLFDIASVETADAITSDHLKFLEHYPLLQPSKAVFLQLNPNSKSENILSPVVDSEDWFFPSSSTSEVAESPSSPAQTFVLLEAVSEEAASIFVSGIKWMIARLSFNLIVGNLSISCELPMPEQQEEVTNTAASHSPASNVKKVFSADEESMGPRRPPIVRRTKVMNDITFHMVDKALDRSSMYQPQFVDK